MSTRRYWARFVLMLALGTLIGLLMGQVLESVTDTEGWGVFVATAGFVVALIGFALTT